MASDSSQVAFDLVIDCHDWARLCDRPDELMRELQSPNVESIWARKDDLAFNQDIKSEFVVARDQVTGAIVRK
jgi:hypothetical protein